MAQEFDINGIPNRTQLCQQKSHYLDNIIMVKQCFIHRDHCQCTDNYNLSTSTVVYYLFNRQYLYGQLEHSAIIYQMIV